MTSSDEFAEAPQAHSSWQAGIAADIVALLLRPKDGYERAKDYLESYSQAVAGDCSFAVAVLNFFQDESHRRLLDAYVYYRTWEWPGRLHRSLP